MRKVEDEKRIGDQKRIAENEGKERRSKGS